MRPADLFMKEEITLRDSNFLIGEVKDLFLNFLHPLAKIEEVRLSNELLNYNSQPLQLLSNVMGSSMFLKLDGIYYIWGTISSVADKFSTRWS